MQVTTPYFVLFAAITTSFETRFAADIQKNGRQPKLPALLCFAYKAMNQRILLLTALCMKLSDILSS